MKLVNVLLLKDVPKLGKAGDVVRVRWGYAKNYLIPRGLAVEATPSVLKQWENRQRMKEISLKKRKAKMEQVAKRLAGERLQFVLKTNEEGKPFGSVSAKDVADKLREMGYEVEKSQVLLEEAIGEFGTHEVEIKLHPEVVAKVKVKVDPEE
ncbi:MAG: 50S ribosomal protein L9 [Thermotogae bacterium]|nr:50S ribosomal protein L9 [Thermotogota bacterium]